jgi:hypothetical protein
LDPTIHGNPAVIQPPFSAVKNWLNWQGNKSAPFERAGILVLKYEDAVFIFTLYLYLTSAFEGHGNA